MDDRTTRFTGSRRTVPASAAAIIAALLVMILAAVPGCAPGSREVSAPAISSPAPSSPSMFDTRVATTIATESRHNIAWSHDGRLLASVSARGLRIVPVGEWDREREVFLSSPAFAGLKDTYLLWDQVVAWSPDDSLVALGLYSEREDGKMLHHVYLFDWREGSGRFLREGSGFSLEDWERDGRLLLNDSLGADWIVDPGGGRRERIGVPYREARALVDIPADYHLWQSPSRWLDGSVVTMVYDEAHDRGLLLEWSNGAYHPLVPDGGNPLMEIVTSAASQGGIAPSPDGTRLAWTEWVYLGQGRARSLLKLYDRRTNRILLQAASDSSGSRDWSAPAWSPDGSLIALAAVRDTAASVAPVTIWIMKIE